MTTAKAVADIARELGFHRAAIVPIASPGSAGARSGAEGRRGESIDVAARRHDAYRAWLDAGYAGGMTYLATPAHVEPRADPRALLPSARTLIVVALAYPRDTVPATALTAKIARYARGEDYHLVMRDRLVALADRLATLLDTPVASRPCVDSAPVLERAWAERGGLGFIAKNTMLIAPGAGSYIVLGELLLDVELPPTDGEAIKPRCGTCRSCLDACPTGAFVDAYVLDARRCISYLTIEHHGSIPVELRPAIGTWVFGCDVCQEVCPFNAGSGEPPEPQLAPKDTPDLVQLAMSNTNQLRRFVKRTALRRVPREVLLRNVAVALGNTHDPRAIPALEHLLADRSELVREHAAWALTAVTGSLATPRTPPLPGPESP